MHYIVNAKNSIRPRYLLLFNKVLSTNIKNNTPDNYFPYYICTQSSLEPE